MTRVINVRTSLQTSISTVIHCRDLCQAGGFSISGGVRLPAGNAEHQTIDEDKEGGGEGELLARDEVDALHAQVVGQTAGAA